MKKNILAAAAVVFAISLSAFTVSDNYNHYAVYQSGVQTDVANYVIDDITQPATDAGTSGAFILNWFKIVNTSPVGVTEPQFDAAFASFDTGTLNTLNDELDIPNQLDIKRVP